MSGPTETPNEAAPRVLTERQILFRMAVSLMGWSKRLCSSEDCSDIPAKLKTASQELSALRQLIARRLAGADAAWEAHIEQRTDYPSPRDRGFFEAGYAAAPAALPYDADVVLAALRYRAVRERAYAFGVGNPTSEQLDADVDAYLVASGAGREDDVVLKGWTRVGDGLPERMSDGRQFSREVLAVDRSRNLPPRICRVHYYPNQMVWDGGSDPTHWRDIPALPDEI